MRALVLVDLDNVLDDEGMPGLVSLIRPFFERTARRWDIGECIVAFAMNTATALQDRPAGRIKEPLGAQAVEDAAKAIAELLAAQLLSTEIALAPTMPQTADVLIARLAQESPSAEAAGDFELAVLVSGDRGLQADLGKHFTSQGWEQSERRADRYCCMGWAATGKARFRKPPPKAQMSGSAAPEIENTYTALVNTRAHAGWAAEQTSSLGGFELMVMADWVESEPWCLSHWGATRHSLRGIFRALTTLRLDGERPHLGPVCQKDGLEIRGKAERPEEVYGATAASVGIGAARFEGGAATLATRLPVDLLKGIEGPMRVERHGLLDREVLQRLSTGVPASEFAVDVRFTRLGADLVAKVQHSMTHQPRLWWRRDSHATSEQRLEGEGPRVAQDVLGIAVAYRTGERGTPLGLRSPLTRGAEVDIDTRIAAGAIGQGWWTPPHGKKKRVAVFSPRRPLSGRVSVVAIQEAHEDRTVTAWARLSLLPLVVPC